MYIIDLEEGMLIETKMVWRKIGNKIKRAIRCTSGPRAGRVVANAAQCSKPIDYKKRVTLKKTKARLGKRITRKAQKTKKTNPTSKKLKVLNRGRK